MGPFDHIYKAIRPLLIFGRKAAATEERRRILNIFNNAMCENQAKLAEYSYLAAEKHKDIKNFLSSGVKDKAHLKQLVVTLDEFLVSEFISACNINYEYIHRYFEGRSHHPPRLCVKLSSKDTIVDPSIRDNCIYQTPPCPVADNTGFKRVDLSGKWYLCNNIPSQAQVGDYKNPRIDDNRARNYRPPTLVGIRSKLFKSYVDKKWHDCWMDLNNGDGRGTRPPIEACYKSTLIVPMTLIGARLSRHFKDRFHIQEFHEKAIFGFLCMDHQHSEYFDDDDVKAGYIFADILSLYLISSMVYSLKSKTYQTAVTLST